MVHHPKHEYITIFALYVLSIFLIFTTAIFSIFIKNNSKDNKKEIRTTVAQTAPLTFNKSLFAPLVISGKAYVIYDLQTHQVIASKNENEILPLASLTKVMTALTAINTKGRDGKVTIRQSAIEDGYDLGLKKNQVWSLDELLKYVLVFSSNDGATAIAESYGNVSLFVSSMNEQAKKIGLNFVFTDPAGRDIDGKIGGLGNALDVAKMFEVARKEIPDLLDATTKKRQTLVSSSGRISGVPNTNQEIESLPGAEASKTGYTDLAGGNLAVVVDISLGHPVVIVVLGSSREGRFKDVELLYKALKASMSKSPSEINE